MNDQLLEDIGCLAKSPIFILSADHSIKNIALYKIKSSAGSGMQRLIAPAEGKLNYELLDAANIIETAYQVKSVKVGFDENGNPHGMRVFLHNSWMFELRMAPTTKKEKIPLSDCSVVTPSQLTDYQNIFAPSPLYDSLIRH